MSPLRIRILNLQYPPDVNSTGALMAQLAEGLKAKGHDVDVVTSFPHYEKFRVWPEYRRKLTQRGEHKGIRVRRLWVYADGKKDVLTRRLASYLSFNLLAFFALLGARRKADVILAPNGSFFTGLTAWAAGGLRRTPYVYNVQDIYPDTPVKAGQLKDGFQVRTLRRIEKFMYRRAARVSVITEAFRQDLLHKGVPADKIDVIPNFVDTSFIRPLPRQNAWSARHGLDDRFVVTHAGNLGFAYDFEGLVEAAAILRDDPRFVFLIVGDGVKKADIERKVKELRLENVRLLPFQPREDLPWLRATSDVQVSVYRHGSASHSMPSKLYEIMASGRPVLASAEADSDVASLVRGLACGVCVGPEDPKALADALLRLAGDRDLALRMGAAGRAAAEAKYSREAVTAAYESMLTSVIQQRKDSKG